MPKRTEANRKTNIGVARAVPLILLAIIGYASWVVTKVICINYLIRPTYNSGARPRRGTAAAVLATYYLLLIITLISYGRLLDVVFRYPGLIPHGPQWHAEVAHQQKGKHARHRSNRSNRSSEDEKSADIDPNDKKMPKEHRVLADDTLPFKVDEFWKRDVFVCNPDGRPPFCSTCYNWKPDRAHHCSELNRCILKVDHFCPWVGGVVSETSFKFFIQFTFYAALYTLQILIVTAYFFAERGRLEHGFLNVNWIVMLALAGLFWLFSAGMCMSTCQFAIINSTTIENLNRKTKVWYLAVYVPAATIDEAARKGMILNTISYPRPPHELLQTLQQHGAEGLDASSSAADTMPAETRTFAILESPPGANPFDIGPLSNFQEIMGMTLWEWLSPVRPSPCLKHDNPESLYKLGVVVVDMKRRTGLETWTSHHHSRRRRRSRSYRERTTRSSGQPGS